MLLIDCKICGGSIHFEGSTSGKISTLKAYCPQCINAAITDRVHLQIVTADAAVKVIVDSYKEVLNILEDTTVKKWERMQSACTLIKEAIDELDKRETDQEVTPPPGKGTASVEEISVAEEITSQPGGYGEGYWGNGDTDIELRARELSQVQEGDGGGSEALSESSGDRPYERTDNNGTLPGVQETSDKEEKTGSETKLTDLDQIQDLVE